MTDLPYLYRKIAANLPKKNFLRQNHKILTVALGRFRITRAEANIVLKEMRERFGLW